MISSSYSIVSSLLFVGFTLTGEFTSLDEPTDVSEVVATRFFLPTDLNSSDLRGK
jgi:hypothetical protein